MRRSTIALLVCYLLIAGVHFGYYPKWQQAGAEATISYDVSGYYMYLPAIFIYQDLKQTAFLEDIIKEYHPTSDPYQVFTHESGNKVMKYSAGQAVMYTPFFLLGHLWASVSSNYPADGFSLPYQLMISLGSLVVSFLGLYWLMVLLRLYFRDGVVALTLVLIAFGTNYLNYSAIDGAMTHNNVFTLYALLLLTTDRFYRSPRVTTALLIGLCIGLAALTRPTEIIAALIPILWMLDVRKRQAIVNRFKFFGRHWQKLVGAMLLTLAIGSIQLVYWKYVSGDWLVYSYQDQGFDWLKAHIHSGLFSYKAGWLVYTPLMIFGVLGFVPLFWRRSRLATALFLHAALFVYVAFAWSVWWYGGSLGQRTMVQAYVVLAFPLAAFMEWAFWARTQVPGDAEKEPSTTPFWKRGGRLALAAVIGLFVYHNLWFTHQAHRGGLFLTEQMTKAYYWRTLYTYGRDYEDQLALDTPEFFPGTPAKRELLKEEGFEDRSTEACGMGPITGNGALCLIEKEQNSPNVVVDIDLAPRTWVRATVAAKIDARRNNRDNYAQMLISFRRDGEEVKRRLIRMHRVLNHDWRRELQIDAKVPDGGADQVVVSFWNGGNSQPALVLDDLRIEAIYR
jgi:hypothetical protein